MNWMYPTKPSLDEIRIDTTREQVVIVTDGIREVRTKLNRTTFWHSENEVEIRLHHISEPTFCNEPLPFRI